MYSWRLSSELKSDLEREAPLRKMSISAVLNPAVREWLKQSAVHLDHDEGQRRLHEAASKCLGGFADRNSRRAERARQRVRERMRRCTAR